MFNRVHFKNAALDLKVANLSDGVLKSGINLLKVGNLVAF
jgi:hypothetical protein